MKLSHYLKERECSQTEFAKRIGISDAFLSRLLTGERKPNGRLVLKIEKETGREVTLRDFFEPVEGSTETEPNDATLQEAS